jgi:hypothetical protein
MYTTTAAWPEILRTGGGWWYGYATATYAGEPIRVDDGDGGLTDHLPLHVDGSNEVPVDGSTPGSRRTLTATLAPIPGLFDALARIGVELRAYSAVRYLDGSVESQPQGVFDVDVARTGYAANGSISLTGVDRWQRVVNGRFFKPRASAHGVTVRAQIATLLTEVLPAGTLVQDLATSTATVPAQTWDRDRDKAIQDLAAAASLDVFFDRNGGPVIRDAPLLAPLAPTFTIDASETGLLIDADRERSRQKTYNIVVVNGQAVDGSAPFATQYVWDNDPTSATYAGSGTGAGSSPPAASTAGSMGQRPTFYSSPLLRNTTQAQAAGRTILQRVLGLEAQLTLSSVPVPMLDDGDTILVQLPGPDAQTKGVTEVHLVDAFTVPLVPHKNPMPITTRSTRPDDVTDS